MSHSYTPTLSQWTAAHAAEHKQKQIHIQKVYVTGETLKELGQPNRHQVRVALQ